MAKKNAASEPEFENDAEDNSEGVGFGDGQGEGKVVDLSGVSEEGTFSAIPRGTYQVTVDNLSYDISQRSGNPMWTWTLEVCEGEYTGRKLFYHTVFAENGLTRVKQALMRIQLEDGSDYAKELANSAFDPEKVADEGRLLGGRFTARVDTRKYEGQMRNNVKGVFVPQAGESGFLGS